MAPETTAEAVANKRKRELDEHAKRKRRRQDHAPSKPGIKKGQQSDSKPVAQELGANGSKHGIADGREMALDIIAIDGQDDKQQKRKTRSALQRRGSTKDNARKWTISNPVGGRILNIDPILTDDDKHLILAYNTSIQVYSTSDSLLLRKVQLPFSRFGEQRDEISAVCPSVTSPNLIWVASYSGSVWLIDWTTGTGSEAHMELPHDRVYDMSIDSVKIGKITKDVIYVSAKDNETWHIVAYDVQDLKLVGTKRISSHPSTIRDLKIAHHGQIFAAYAKQDIILGYRKQDTISAFDDIAYEVVTLDASDAITSLDIQVTSRVHLTRRSQRETGDKLVINLVVGCARGAMFIYNDILPQIRLLDASEALRNTIQPRKHHWHRKAVHAVKWSRDGNYILSGGSESTLVLRQADTEKLDFLPHLSATIENIVVSKRGSAYALHLDDNSALVLSTADLKPITYISGIQATLSPQPFSKDDTVKRVGKRTPDRLTSIPAAISPSNPSQLLLCVGNGQRLSYSGSGPSMPLMQSLDLTTMQSVYRQALTRTNPTDINVTPRGHTITEPRVTAMTYSHDGRWFATTDEWQPPSRDIDSLDCSSSQRKEIYLKFWSVSTENQSLELMTRIDAPHRSNKAEPVFGLAADPRSDRFATIGGDGMARLWQPTIRQKNGLMVKGKNGRKLYSWSCSKAISLYNGEVMGSSDVPNELVQGSGAVAFSEDGSVLVCASAYEHGATIQIIDTESGTIRQSLHDLIQGHVQGICILSTNLVVVSDALMVYDLVLDELRYGVHLRKAKSSEGEDTRGPGASVMTHLAADYQTSRFAVAVSRGKWGSTKIRSELAIFGSDGCEPELVQKFPNPITSLVSSTASCGFLVLDSAAQLWSVVESMDTKALAFAQPLADLQLDQEPITKGPEAKDTSVLLLDGDDEQIDEDDIDIAMTDVTDGDVVYPAVVAPQKLAELFDTAPSFAMPPIEDMFYQVTKMFSAKPTIPTSS